MRVAARGVMALLLVMVLSACQGAGWGYNAFGAVGDGTLTNRNAPSAQAGAAWLTVDAGNNHSCGIRYGGTAWCWGHNDHGKLGTGTAATLEPAPVAVSGSDATYTTVDAGGDHTCAIRSDASLWCWGRDIEGQMGDGANGGSNLVPKQVPGGGWRSVSAGYSHTCATRTDGTLWCWGDNLSGQIGDGTIENIRVVPTQIAGTTWASVSAGTNHTCARRTDGTAWCWGDDHDGALGQGSFTWSLTPIQVPGTWTAIEAGGRHTCGIRPDHTAWCWGLNEGGRLGLGFESGYFDPVQSPSKLPGDDWAAISPGLVGTCALRLDRTAWCWGPNSLGSVGDGTTTKRLSPTAVAGGERWLELSSGGHHVVAVRWPDEN